MYILKGILKKMKHIRIILMAKIRRKQITIRSSSAIRLFGFI